MLALPLIHTFRLSEDGVRCGTDGLHVGAVPLLRRDGPGARAPRPPADVEPQLTELYGAPIDISRKVNRLTTVARALDCGDATLAAIAAVLLGFPDPPGFAKDAPARDGLPLVAQLAASGLLEGDWQPDKHPRAGCPPNAGWFVPKPKETNSATLPGNGPNLSAARDTFRLAARLVRSALQVATDLSIQAGEAAVRTGGRPLGVIGAILDLLSDSGELNRGDQQVVDELRASVDSPKTLEELQKPPSENTLGYQRHHAVEQNPANVLKAPAVHGYVKFGRDALEDACNLFWVPTYKHEQITGYYNSSDESDPSRTHRQVVNEQDFVGQFAAGLDAMRKYGVLK